MPDIYFKDFGVADCFNNNSEKWIEINRNLKYFPELYRNTLKHEKEHLKSNDTFDFRIESKSIKNEFKNTLEWLKFNFKYPKSLLSMFPFAKSIRTKTYAIDYFQSLIWLSIIITTLLIIL